MLFLVSDSTCITPILNAFSSTASQRSTLSVTPSKSYATVYLTPRSSFSSNTFGESTSAEFYSFVTDSDDLNETVTQPKVSIYESILEATGSSRLLSATRSVKRRLQLLSKFTKLQRLSIVRAAQINIRGDQPNETDDCTCKNGLFDANCLKSFMEMSVQAPEYRSNPQMTSTPIITKDVYEQNIFNVARIKKVELHELAPKVPEYHGKFEPIYKMSFVYNVKCVTVKLISY